MFFKVILGLLFLATGMLSCSSLPSGQYIQLSRDSSAQSLARDYHISRPKILHYNQGKNFKRGEWIFIPKPIGLANAPFSRWTKELFDERYLFTGRFLWPVPTSTRISSGFGMRKGRHHDGIDIPASKGTHILASDKGKVVFSGRMRGYGKVIILGHKGGIYTVYAHNKKNLVRKGNRVSRAQPIARVGNTGRTSGPHLHYEVRANKRAVNPLKYINRSRKTLIAQKD